MSRYTGSSQKSDQNLSKSNLQAPVSIISARNKLKEVQDKIYEARHRLDILSKRQSRAEYKSMHKTRMDGFKNYIRDYAQSKNQMKKDYEIRKSVQIEMFHETNLQKRAEHKEKLSQMKQMLQTQNQWVYENIRKQKQINEKSIERQKSKDYEQKRRRRDAMYENQQKRIAYFKQFLKNKHLTAKLSKDQESHSLQEKILQREKLLERLQRQGSNMSMNPESESMTKSVQGAQKSTPKDFRIIPRKNKLQA